MYLPFRPRASSTGAPRPRLMPFLIPLMVPLAVSASGRMAAAATLNVPAQYATIQAAVGAAQSGDTVLVADGTYSGPGNRDIDFGGKNLTVTSQSGAATTIIDCGGAASTDGTGDHRGFYLHSGETGAVLSGLTIQNGYESSGGGAGINDVNVPLTVQSCVFKNNAAGSGGALSSVTDGGGAVLVTGCTFSGNTASANGGAIFEENDAGGSAITVSNCTLTGNTAGSYGGGVYAATLAGGTGAINVTGCTLAGNTAGSGAGLFNSGKGGGAITVSGCTFSANIQSGNGVGGGIYNFNGGSGVITASGCAFTGNTARDGGGIYNVNSGLNGQIALTRCTFTGNTADFYGGGIHNNNFNGGTGAISVTGCTLAGNTADFYGGGIENGNFNSGTGAISVSNCTLTGNTAGTGAGIDNDNEGGSPITLSNCTLAGNTTGGGAGDIYSVAGSGATIVLTNDIVSGSGGVRGNFTAAYCDIPGSAGTPASPDAAHNFSADPQFMRAPGTNGTTDPGDLHLQPASPCLGAGTAAGAPAADKDGNARPAPPSIGAHDAGDLILLSFPSSVAGGSVLTATVTLSGPAPTATVVGLSSSDPVTVRLFRSVLVPAGSSSATFTINTFRSHSTQTVTLTATLGPVVLATPLTITGR